MPDLAQEVYLRLLRVPDHEAIRNPEAYLFTVASHVARQHLLRQSLDTALIDITEELPELTLPAGEEPPAKVENFERMEQFEREILDRLSPRVRAALLLHRIWGLSVRETAAQMGIGCGTVRMYLVEAVRRCRKSELSGGTK